MGGAASTSKGPRVKDQTCGHRRPCAACGVLCVPLRKDNPCLYWFWIFTIFAGMLGVALQVITTIAWLYNRAIDPSQFSIYDNSGPTYTAAQFHVWLPGLIGYSLLIVVGVFNMIAGDIGEGLAMLTLGGAVGDVACALLLNGTLHNINTTYTFPGIILYFSSIVLLMLLMTWQSMWDDLTKSLRFPGSTSDRDKRRGGTQPSEY